MSHSLCGADVELWNQETDDVLEHFQWTDVSPHISDSSLANQGQIAKH